MAALDGIVVVAADIGKVCPEYADLLFPDLTPAHSITDVITEAKNEVYGFLKIDYKKHNPTYTDAEIETDLAKVKDLPEAYLKDKIVKTTLRILYTQNKAYEEVEVYNNLADRVPFLYYIDLDEDSVVDQDEEKHVPQGETFHR